MSAEGFEHELEQVYERYRHRELDERLDEVAKTMQESILQKILAEAIFGIEIEAQDDTEQAVQQMNSYLDMNNLKRVEEKINNLEKVVDDESHMVNMRIQEARTEISDKMEAMKRLNRRVEQVDEESLEEIAGLLDGWNWKEKVYPEDGSDEDIEELKRSARKYGESIRQSYDRAKDELFGSYKGTELEGIVDGLLNEERFSLDNITDEQLRLLRDSELEEHVELSLS
jgi:hypothetical protein